MILIILSTFTYEVENDLNYLSTFTYDSLKPRYGTENIFNCKNVKWIMVISRMFNEVAEFVCCLIDFFLS
jgi:hypothetical protein